MNKDEVIKNCKKIDLEINEDIIKKLDTYCNLLIEWNNKFNLTSIIKKEDIYLLHFYDSIMLTKYIDLNNKCICDFGTGAGFPGMILAIFFKNTKVTLIESNNKKCMFLKEIVNVLNLNNVEIINKRMEDYSKNNKEIFDLITCRAVTLLPVILELSVQSLKINGLIMPLKANCSEEIEMSNKLLNNLNLKLISINSYKLPISNANRTIPIYKKIGKTDQKYPRNYSVIMNNYKIK